MSDSDYAVFEHLRGFPTLTCSMLYIMQEFAISINRVTEYAKTLGKFNSNSETEASQCAGHIFCSSV